MRYKLFLLVAALFGAAFLLPGVASAQALYSDNFDTDTVGSISPKFVNIGSAAFVVNTNTPVTSPNAFGETTPVDGDIAVMTGQASQVGMTVQYSETIEDTSSSNFGNVAVLLQENSAGTAGYLVNFNVSTQLWAVYKQSSGSYVTTGLSGNYASYPFIRATTNGEKVWIKADYNGTGTIKYKMWQVGTAEPGSWDGTVTDSTPITTAGYMAFRNGIFNSSSTPSQADDLYFGNTGATFSASSYKITGPTTLTAGSAATYTLATNQSLYPASGDIVTYSDNLGTHGTFSPTTQAVSTSGSITFSFTYTPPAGSSGAVTLTATSANGLTSGTISATISGGAATSYTMTEGATSGPTGSPVTLTFTGNGTTTATITPSLSGVTGAFSPTTVSLNNTTGVTVTFTPSSNGVATISSTNSGSLTNPTNLTYTVATPTTYLATNALIHYSPYEWYPSPANSAEMETNCSSATATVNVSGVTSITVNFDINSPVNAGAALRTQVDALAATNTTVSSSVTITLPNTSAHTVQIILPWFTQTVDRWGTPGSVARIVSVVVPGGGTLNTVTGIPTPKILLYSDSRGEGCVINDATLAWTYLLGKSYGCETGLRSFASDGWSIVNGSGSVTGYIVPFFTPGNDTQSIWDKYYSGLSLLSGGLYSPTPTYIVDMLGINDIRAGQSNTSIANSVSGVLLAQRTAAGGSCKILVVQDFSGDAQTAVSTGYATYQAAHPDPYTYLVPITAIVGLNDTGASYLSSDGAHPTAFGHAIVLGQVEKSVLATTTSAFGGRGRTLN